MNKTKKVEKTAAEELVAEIKRCAQTKGLNHVFTTFLEVMANCLAAEGDPYHAEERNNRCAELVSGMEEEEIWSYAMMCAWMEMAVEENWDEPCDILGTICHELQLNDRHDGQYFKPDHICRLMSMLVNRAGDGPDNLDWKGKITDPACGSGSLILGMVWDMKQKNFDYRHRILFIAQDIDIQCVWMAYIQLTLYQVPAVVMHRNTRTQEEWSRWFTPYAIMQAQASEPEDAEGAGQ